MNHQDPEERCRECGGKGVVGPYTERTRGLGYYCPKCSRPAPKEEAVRLPLGLKPDFTIHDEMCNPIRDTSSLKIGWCDGPDCRPEVGEWRKEFEERFVAEHGDCIPVDNWHEMRGEVFSFIANLLYRRESEWRDRAEKHEERIMLAFEELMEARREGRKADEKMHSFLTERLEAVKERRAAAERVKKNL